MRDLVTRFRFHPHHDGLAVADSQHKLVGKGKKSTETDEWFYLLNAPPQALLELGKTRVFESALHASDWIGQNLQGNSFQQGMALSFNLPFPASQSKQSQFSCVPADSASLQKYIDFMVKEIQLLGSTLAVGASVLYLHWFGDVVTQLTPSELTQLMFHIDRSFKILKNKQSRLVFELNGAPESADRIALMAGLGFNTVCINDPTNNESLSSISELPDWISLLHSYNIKRVYVRLKITDANSSVLKMIEALMGHYPAGILLSAENNPCTSAQDITLKAARQFLIKANYRSVRNNFFVYQGLETPPVTHCLKGMGLGAVSYTRKFQICNTTKLDDYYSRLSTGHLPIHSVTELHCEI
jgi:hypothetical protein